MRQENRIAMMLIMLTFVRAGNIRFAQWKEIDQQAAMGYSRRKDEDAGDAYCVLV
ncbi:MULTISPECIES: hypothetical protein [Neisseria]|uniref:hypothetical protein n=1 Tax=Neisseria TaxID=482 RepID=UPI00164B9BF5|nr:MULTISPECIES: hypothetical protein [unclassified Neisseria]